MNAAHFDDVADIYEAMVDWPRRLAADEILLRDLFDEVGVCRVADVACGTGHHAAMFHGWGLQVEGADISPKMVESARRQFGSPEGLTWSVRSFEDPIPAQDPLDAVVCLGNSLALAGDRVVVQRAVRSMVDALRPGGLLVLHVLNAWRLVDGPILWQKCLRLSTVQGETLITKGVQRVGDRACGHMIAAPLDAPDEYRYEWFPFLSFEEQELRDSVRSAGATDIRTFGSQKKMPYERESSVDLIVVARKDE